MSYSPWGKIQTTKVYARGLRDVSTASHGGFMVSRGLAERILSKAAQKRGMEWHGYLCYEEDCDWAIVVMELTLYWERIFENASEDIKLNPYAYLVKSLSRWNADYLLDRGYALDDENYRIWKNHKEADKMRADKHPDLIVSASSQDDGSVRVLTADRKEHFVTSESYSGWNAREFNLLSGCELVEK